MAISRRNILDCLKFTPMYYYGYSSRCNLNSGSGRGNSKKVSSTEVNKYFQLLGLSREQCTVEDIRKAYISLSKKYHPDSNAAEEATEQFIKVSGIAA